MQQTTVAAAVRFAIKFAASVAFKYFNFFKNTFVIPELILKMPKLSKEQF